MLLEESQYVANQVATSATLIDTDDRYLYASIFMFEARKGTKKDCKIRQPCANYGKAVGVVAVASVGMRASSVSIFHISRDEGIKLLTTITLNLRLQIRALMNVIIGCAPATFRT